MPEFVVQRLLQSPIVTIQDTQCRGSHRHPAAEECTKTTQLVFPYRGAYVRRVGRDHETVADSSRVVLFNAGEGYRVSHPVGGGDASLTVVLDEERLRELIPVALRRDGESVSFRRQDLQVDAHTQALAAMLRHRLRANAAALEAETLALTLVQCALGTRTPRAMSGTSARQKLADRAKLVLASDPARRWTLAEIAAEVRVSPVYLTQMFQQVEGVPLYRYQLRLRLARALDLLSQYDDLTELSLELDFSSHSHFSAAFRQAYGRTPSEFRRSALRSTAASPARSTPPSSRRTRASRHRLRETES